MSARRLLAYLLLIDWRVVTLDKLALVHAAPGPRDKWGPFGARAAAAGHSLNVCARVEAGVSDYFLYLRFRRMAIEATARPAKAVLGDHQSVRERPSVTASELDRSSAPGESHWCPSGG